MSRNKLKRWLTLIVVTPLVLFAILIVIIAWKQEAIVQELITNANKDFVGEIKIEGSHISPFANFPHVSIDLDHVQVYEGKGQTTGLLLDIQDVYLGFDVITLISGNMEIKSIKLSDGFIKLVQHPDGSFNIANALSGREKIESPEEEFHLDIKVIQLENIDLLKLNETSNILVEAFIDEAHSRFKTSPDHTLVYLYSRFQMNVIADGDTTFVKHKHFEIKTELDYLQDQQLLTIKPSELHLERAVFNMDGSIDFDDDMNLDLKFHGNKPNFDLFLAFAPEELAPALDRYDNSGKIFFEASISGKSINGHNPKILVDFGCEDAFFDNKVTHKKLDKLFFKGHFTSGEKGDASSMEFSLLDFSARPEAGTFSGNLRVKNFESPDIDMQIKSQFQLDFLAKFFNINDLQDLRGELALTMNFHDVVDLTHPEKSIEKLNESYFTELDVKNLSFKSPDFHLPVHDINIKATMDGHKAEISQFDLKVGDSDLSIKATISDLPAIIHHTADPVLANLTIHSKLLDIRQLTSSDTVNQKPINERIEDMSMKFTFKSSARAFTESPNLPVGEFFIDDLYAKLNHYPHTLHDFHADVFIDEQNFRVVDFTGMLDQSDFHFNGRLENYNLWFLNEPLGETRVEFNLNSTMLQLDDVFSYGGENFVPEDYRHEEFTNLKAHGFADLHFEKGLKTADVTFDKLETKMKVHPLRFENFKGRFHYEDNHLMVQNFSGKLGKSEFAANLNYYLGPDSIIRKRDNHFTLTASRLDFDELFNYTPPPPSKTATPQTHEDVFNIYDLPFSDMAFDFDIKHLNYHRYLIDNFYVKARTTKNHYIYIDTISLDAAGGQLYGKGYFNGTDRNKIYFSPAMSFKNIDLDKFLFKFENFGQDHIVSENLHGKLSGKISGKVHMHADMTPIIDDSEIHLDLEVLRGRLENYSTLHAMADYFKNKNLDNVRFDTLRNKLDINKGILTIPAMTINSTLGFIELSGKQDMNMNMDYTIRVPVKLVTQAVVQKLFGRKDDEQPGEDEIQYRDQTKRIPFVNIRMTGTPDKYKIQMVKIKD